MEHLNVDRSQGGIDPRINQIPLQDAELGEKELQYRFMSSSGTMEAFATEEEMIEAKKRDREGAN